MSGSAAALAVAVAATAAAAVVTASAPTPIGEALRFRLERSEVDDDALRRVRRHVPRVDLRPLLGLHDPLRDAVGLLALREDRDELLVGVAGRLHRRVLYIHLAVVAVAVRAR